MRKEIENRPLLLVCLSILCGFGVKELLIFVVVPALFVLLLRSRRSLAILATGTVIGFAIFPSESPYQISKNKFFNGKLNITSIPSPHSNMMVCEASDGRFRYQFRFDRNLSITLGDSVKAVGVVEPPNEIVADSFKANGLVGVLKAAPGRVEIVSRGWFVWRAATSWRNNFLEWSSQVLGRGANVSVEALCFNVSTNLTPDYKESLQRTGTIHIISASGMHVMIVAVFLQFCLSYLPIPKLGRIGILSAVLLLYAAAAGLEAPVVRSASMCIVLMSAYAFRKEGDILSALASVCLIYLLFDPNSIRQVGFQLSFLSVASLGLFGFYEKEEGISLYSNILNIIKYTLRASAVVSLATAPVVAYHFGIVSLIAPIANLAVAFVLGPIVIATIASALTMGWAAPVSAGLLVVVAMPLAKWIEVSVTAMADLPFASINVPGFSALWLLPIYALFGISWKRHARKA